MKRGKMRHLVLSVAILCVAFGVGWAQNRGSSRYAPQPEEFEEEPGTRAPRPPSSRAIPNRRQRPTRTPQVPTEEEPQHIQDAPPPVRTSARQLLPRGPPRQVAPPLILDPTPLYRDVPDDSSQISTEAPEGRPLGRRRRPKKRRRPQAVEAGKPDGEAPEKSGYQISEKDKTSIATLLDDDQKRPQPFQGGASPRRPEWDDKKINENSPSQEAQAPQYFRPQAATNRLPVEQPEVVENSRRYPGSQPETVENSRRYPGSQPESIPQEVPNARYNPENSAVNSASYVPVLSPIRTPELTRHPQDDYTEDRNNDEIIRHTISFDRNNRQPNRGQQVPRPVSDPRNIIRDTEAKPVRNAPNRGPQENVIPLKSQSEVRLPQNEQPLLARDFNRDFANAPQVGDYDPSGELLSQHQPNEKPVDDAQVYSNPSNRLPNPSEVHYESVNPADDYPSYLPRERADAPPLETVVRQPSRNSIDSYNPPRRDSRKPQPIQDESSNQQRDPSRYQPPLQRSGSRFSQEAPEVNPRSRSVPRYQDTTDSPPPRSRGSSRYQTDVAEEPIRVREPTRTRGSTPHQADPTESTRRRPTRPVPVEPPVPQRTRTPVPQNDDEIRQDTASLRNTLRSRPQYVRDPYSQPDPEEDDSNRYAPEPSPRDQEHRASDQRIPQRQQPQYQAPQNPRTDRQQTSPPRLSAPQYQPPQNPRVERQHSRPRQEEPAPQSSQGRSSRFNCPEPYGFFADKVQCDRYYECRNGTAVENLCNDGLAFNENSAPKFLRCDSLRDVDCRSRPELQEPQATKHCPRKFGLYPHNEDCTKFWNCVDGVETVVQCPPGLAYNDERATCDWADLVKSSCSTEELLGFTCPEGTAHDLLDGVYTRYAHPTNCQLHFMCIKGEDGLRRPRMLSCSDYQVFDPATGSCTRSEDVPGCEDFYGERSPKPRRQQAREPVEEPMEEPTPKPRRRAQTRRTRN